MKCILVRLKDNRSSDVLYFPKVESLAIGYLAGYLRANSFEAAIVDEELSGSSREQTIRQLRDSDLIGFTAIAKTQIFQVIETTKELKKSRCNAHISIGGHYPSFLHKELLSLKNTFDSVVRFEGEETFSELAEAIEEKKAFSGIKGLAFKQNGKIIENGLRPLIEDLDSVPFPARDTLPMVLEQGGLPVISSSRGCYNSCSYCSISSFYSAPGGKQFRTRSAENVLAELSELKQNFPAMNEIWFVDDNFVMPGSKGLERTVKLCKGIKNLGLEFQIYLRANHINKKLLCLLKASGLQNIFIGAEAANDFTLQALFNKNISVEQTRKAIKLCNQMKISIDPGFIMFHPWSTMKEIEENIKFLEETKQFTLYGIASFLTPYSFTPIGKKMLSKELAYKKPAVLPAQKLNDFVPYEIMNEKAELLLCLTLDAFEEFSRLPKIFSKLKQKIRKLKSEKNQDAIVLEKKWLFEIKKMNQSGMRFFKELFFFIKAAELSDNEIKPFFEKFRARIKAEIEETAKGLEELVNN
ncbi:MAG: radical SAM protein [Candidatus ainarchaeum sp.]|nr:radical SAM protein [Candidatus ainarchaeum sp.]